jgi:hypothetical protein
VTVQDSRLRVPNGGTVEVGQSLLVQTSPTAWGPDYAVVEVDAQGVLEIGDVSGPAIPGTLRIGQHGTLKGNGTITTNATDGSGTVFNEAGTVIPGREHPSIPIQLGSMLINSNYQQGPEGTLEVQLGGTVLGVDSGYDRLRVDGDLSVEGTLKLNFVGGFTPAVGNTFDLISFTGTHTPSLPTIVAPAGHSFSLEYLPGILRLTRTANLPGDFDADGDVDGADFVAWQTNFPLASGATLAMGDADGDGDVDGADFVVWQTHFPTSSGGAAAPVPEPAAGLSLLLAVAVLAAARRSLRR